MKQNSEKVIATIEVTRSGRLNIDGNYYALEQFSVFRELYKTEDFKFRILPACFLVTPSQVRYAKRALEVFGYEIIS